MIALYRLNIFVDGLVIGFLIMATAWTLFQSIESMSSMPLKPQPQQYCDIA